ncbi:MAG: polyprenyl diphosphate synthase, partial [Sphaerochaetaceae bacterium]
HIGLIMDGNGRWAERRGLPRDAGHIEGLKAVRRILRLAAANPEIDYVSLYVFSTENWRRPPSEVNYLMGLLASRLTAEIRYFLEYGVRILVRGDKAALPDKVQRAIARTESETALCSNLTCIMAINYGGQDEIVRAVNRFILASPGSEITAADVRSHMDLPSVPPPDIIARSAGEHRLSNFLLWDSAYAELASIDALWPDWGERELDEVIAIFKSRVRRFGGLNK